MGKFNKAKMDAQERLRQRKQEQLDDRRAFDRARLIRSYKLVEETVTIFGLPVKIEHGGTYKQRMKRIDLEKRRLTLERERAQQERLALYHEKAGFGQF